MDSNIHSFFSWHLSNIQKKRWISAAMTVWPYTTWLKIREFGLKVVCVCSQIHGRIQVHTNLLDLFFATTVLVFTHLPWGSVIVVMGVYKWCLHSTELTATGLPMIFMQQLSAGRRPDGWNTHTHKCTYTHAQSQVHISSSTVTHTHTLTVNLTPQACRLS